MGGVVLKTRGKNISVSNTLVAKVSFIGDKKSACFSKSITEESWTVSYRGKLLLDNIRVVSHLDEGDIVAIHDNGLIRTLYRKNSSTNSLFLTERCNSNCLMCSQPPMDRDDVPQLLKLNKQLISLIPKDCIELGMTGGEPTLLGLGLIDLISDCRDKLPSTTLHILSNARRLGVRSFAKQVAMVNHERLIIGIPLFSHDWRRHDYVVQAKDAWYQTIKGVFNCYDFGIGVEIRIILEKPVIEDLIPLTEFILQNIPFVHHVAFMGLEVTGYTKANIEKVWIEPLEYSDVLEMCVHRCSKAGLNVSIYNLQHCLLPESIRVFSRKSISEWKNDYLDECQKCIAKDECGGFFTTGMSRLPKGIQSLNNL